MVIYVPYENFSYFYDGHYFKGTVMTMTIHRLFSLNCLYGSVIWSEVPLSFFAWRFSLFLQFILFLFTQKCPFFFIFSQCSIKEHMNHRDSELEFQTSSCHQTRCVTWARNIISLCLSFLFSKMVGIKLPNSLSSCRIKWKSCNFFRKEPGIW